MSCNKPLEAYRLLFRTTAEGKSIIRFRHGDVKNEPHETIELPCGKCQGCIDDYKVEWALRCVHEASIFSYNIFLTLTFNDQHLNEQRELDIRDWQLFMKRLRKRFSGIETVTDPQTGKKTRPIRYFHCGEYGPKNLRPHHHACLFNFRFTDALLFSEKGGVKLYVSPTLQELWQYQGFCTIGEVTPASAAYVAGYVQKKRQGNSHDYIRKVDPETGEVTFKQREFVSMSGKPGIGKYWYDRFALTDLYSKGYVTNNGFKQRIPRYYDRLLSKQDPELLKYIKKARMENVPKKSMKENERERKAREKNHIARANQAQRSYDGTENV